VVTCTIRSGPQADQAELAIRDSGAGMPETVRQNLFGRFVAGAGREKRSAGLGLAFVKTVVDRHSGQIRCESGADTGTCFTITFTILPE